MSSRLGPWLLAVGCAWPSMALAQEAAPLPAAPPPPVSPPPATPPPPLAADPAAPPAYVEPPPAPAAAEPVAPSPPVGASDPQAYAGGVSEPPPPAPPPPPPRKPDEGFELPTLSIRVDPLDWLIYGRLGFELEAELLPFMSVEVVPVFVVNDSPPALDQAFDDDVVTQHSNGLGALAGSSVGLGFWLSGKPLRGYVLRAILTNYAFTYRANDELGVFDEVSHTERHLYGFIGSHSRWGAFTLTGGLGVGVELNEDRRCFADGELDAPTSDCPDDDLLIALERRDDPPLGDLNSSTHPVQLLVRLSLGVTF